ncbi:hypothetical protein STRTUCAR8_00211 [Streptomyces turgidiscabies Car8]|uniref:Uncharacterized protein n=1 Tax=Streptomyces turgidiscabies (strain Car8) TaxID=698760 RepID=L7ERU3_STRT8|nr:hypothetical protein STRTUCAR8_00211 [Streptomyces turgidiscabies Car8]
MGTAGRIMPSPSARCGAGGHRIGRFGATHVGRLPGRGEDRRARDAYVIAETARHRSDFATIDVPPSWPPITRCCPTPYPPRGRPGGG